jgi:GR25 family glycosyltransferase involved in LPS biosynthesis
MISYLLTSNKTIERFELTKSHLKDFGYSPKIFWGPEIASEKESNSIGHLEIIKDFLESGETHCLVFEDDCLIENQIPQDIVDNLINTLDFDILLIGGLPEDIIEESEYYKKSNKFLQTHCYIISKSGANKFLSSSFMNKEFGYIDHYYSKIFDKIYTIIPTIAKQNLKFRSKIPKK